MLRARVDAVVAATFRHLRPMGVIFLDSIGIKNLVQGYRSYL